MKEQNVKLHECAMDGLPEIGRPFVAFDIDRERHAIFTRLDKIKIEKENDPSDNAGHISPDGEYYSGPDRWIFSINYKYYIYVDELNLVPQSHYDKVAKEKEEAALKLKQMKRSLIKEYGEADGTKLQEFILIEKNGRKVSFYSYYEHLLKPFEYPFDITGMFKGIKEKFDKDLAIRVVNHKLSKEGSTNYGKYSTAKIKLAKDFVINDWWQDVLLSYNAKGMVKDGYLYVTTVLPKRSMDTEDIRSRLSSQKLLGENKYWSGRGADWDWNLTDEEFSLFKNVLME